MKRFKRYLLTVLMAGWLLPVSGAMAQQASITGSVTDGSGQPIAGATITVAEDPDLQATTNRHGKFTIRAKTGQRLRVTHAGESGKTVTVRRDKVSITLGESGMDIPTGYGLTRSRDELTGAVGVAGAAGLADSRMVINAENALYGRIPGLTAVQNGGLPPAGADLYVRGRGTFTDSSPLVLVDGFERPLFSSTEVGGLSVGEIQNIMLLKDAAALAKYGQRGANGVLLVSTKRGSRKGLQVNASYEQAFTQPTRLPDFVNAPEYARAVNEARANDGQDPRYSPADLEAFDAGNSPYLFPDVDWFDQVLRDSGTRSNFNLSFRGGGDIARYFAMMNLVGDNGLFGPVSRNPDFSTQAKYSRFNFRSNIDVDITDHLLFKLDVAGNIVDRNLAGGGGGDARIFNALYSIPSTAFPVKNPDGSWGGTQIYGNNPVAILTDSGYGQPNSRQYSLSGTLRRDMSQWLDGLRVETTVSYLNFGSFFEQQNKSYSYKSLVPVRDQSGAIVDTSSSTFGQDTDLNFLSSFGNKRQFTDLKAKADYRTTLGDNHRFETMLLFHQAARVFDGQDNTFRRQNAVGNIHVGLSGKYFFDLTASYSGNNWMRPGERFGLFPALSAGWLLSEEEFLKDTGFLDRLKLRGSWGISGSDRLPTNNIYKQAYNNAPGYFFQNGNNFRGGFSEGQLATSDFTFETSYKTNLGIEATLFENMNMTADLFYERRTNILTGTGGRVSRVIGNNPPLETDGIVDNKGFEAGLDWQDAIGEVAYRIGGQFSLARNKIVEMNERFRSYDYLERTGRSVGQWFGLQAVGFFEDQADIENSPRQVFSQVQPGDIKYKDQNGDGIINEFDEVPLGHASGYPEIYFSASLGFNYKGVGFSALFQGTGNYTAYLNTQSVFWPIRNDNTISDYYYDRRWTPETAGSASLPRLTTESNDNNFRPNNIWLADRSYLKLRTVELSYTLPASVTERWRMNEVRIYGRGMNLFSIDNIPVLDPEHLSAGYPIMRSFNMGLEIAF